MRIVRLADGFELHVGETVVIRHLPNNPAFFVGAGRPLIDMYRGNFAIEDRIDERVALRDAVVAGDHIALAAAAGQPPLLFLEVVDGAVEVRPAGEGFNRFWMRLVAETGERLWGGGEQMSYFDMAGRRFPLWTSEPGVGRDKSTQLTWQADVTGKSGGDYWNTNYPQPTFVSSRRYALHVETNAFAAFDFRDAAFHEIEAWEMPARIEAWAAPTFVDLVSQLSTRFGRQPRLPDWAIGGAIVGLKDGERSFERLESFIAAGAEVSALWCEDWVGLRVTSFGKRLFWDWKANATRYPDLAGRIAALAERGIRFMGYVNPYLAADGTQYGEAAERGYLALRQDSDDIYLVDFGEFDCGVVDFTNPDAAAWFAERIIGQEMLDFGLSGWMADFGEYLPVDVRLSNGVDGMLMHNPWPTIWAKVNADAVESRGKTGEAVFFMRAGWTGVQAYCPLLWAGDQSVDFTRHDGIGTVIRAALSSGMLGNAYHHSDIGGYTSLFGNVRTAELIMRWSEMAAFTPVMRSHEGNRPDENLQIDGDPQVLAHFARMTRIHVALAPYVAGLCDEAAATGAPLQRPLFLHFEEDADCYGVETAYLYGPDLLVAPVIEAGAERWPVYLPAGAEWVHVWSGERHTGGQTVEVAAPIGSPPLFWRAGSAHEALFAGLASV
ncbi:alpha-glucosidase [Sphingomonas sp. DBB INV C78]|uniref:alpha-glucosidase n=1 Tax=Sphingomonas sp. DBB INV C78 TaxID=3349434 RepID=UPI0036D37FAA